MALSPDARSPAASDLQREDDPRPRFRVLGWFAAFLLVPAVCVVAFLLASVPARNSLLWLHLASGREIARLGPFAAPRALTYGVENPLPSPSWLYDLGAYQLYQVAGDRGFMIVHALLVAILVFLLVVQCKGRDNLFLPGIGALAATLALGPWLAPGPLLVSALFLAATLLLLDRIREGSRVACGWLIALFLLWANVDSWFILGLAITGLQAVGVFLNRSNTNAAEDRSGRGASTLLLIALFGGAGACLVNPQFFNVFRLPTLLGVSPAAQVLRNDPLGSGLILSPLTSSFWESPIGTSPGGFAFAFLVAAGGFSFLVIRRRDLSQFLPWLAVTGLVLFQVRLLPLFVVVAAPFLVRNLRESLREYRPSSGSVAVLRFLGGLILLGALALPAVAWTGWLQPAPFEPRQWKMEPDRALVRMAAHINRWRDQGRMGPDERVFATTLDAGHYLAWLCPGQSTLLDGRLDQYPAQVARDFLDLRAALQGKDSADKGASETLRQHGIGYVLLADRDLDSFGRAFSRMSNESGWALAALEGQACLFAGPDGAGTPRLPPLDLNRLVVDPTSEQRAPDHRPARSLRPHWADPFWRAQQARSADRDEARLHLALYDQAKGVYLQSHRILWDMSQMAALIGTGANPSDPFSASCGVTIRSQLLLAALNLPEGKPDSPVNLTPAERIAVFMRAGYVARRDQGPMGQLFLAIRACRRALEDNPDDSVAWLLLGQSYWRLVTRSQERGGSDLPQLRTLRLTQTATALNRAVQLRPDLEEAHELLFALYGFLGYRDLQLEHAHALLRIRRKAKPTGEGADRSQQNLDLFTENVTRMEQEVEKLRSLHNTNSANQRILLRAQDALRRGLARQALEILLTSDTAAFGPTGAIMELELLLVVGRAEEAREWLTEELEASLGDRNFHWMRVLIDASEGAMKDAHVNIESLQTQRDMHSGPGNQVFEIRQIFAFGVAQLVLGYRLPDGGPARFGLQVASQQEAFVQLNGFSGILHHQALVHTLHGLLAIEQGDGQAARMHLRKALEIANEGIAIPAEDLVRWWDRVFAQSDAEPRR